MPNQRFDLTAAKAGATVVRRDNADKVVEVIEFTKLPDAELPVRVLFKRADGSVYSGKRHRDGSRKLGRTSQGDLFLAPPPADKWANLDRDGQYDVFDTEAAARNAAANTDEYTHVAVKLPAAAR